MVGRNIHAHLLEQSKSGRRRILVEHRQAAGAFAEALITVL
jgi:hypothetical protein